MSPLWQELWLGLLEWELDVQVLLPGRLSSAQPALSLQNFLWLPLASIAINKSQGLAVQWLQSAGYGQTTQRKSMLKHSSYRCILLECAFHIKALTWQRPVLCPEKMKEDAPRHICILLLGEGVAGSDLISLLVRCFLCLPWGWTSPSDLGPFRTDILSGYRSWVHERRSQCRLILSPCLSSSAYLIF